MRCGVTMPGERLLEVRGLCKRFGGVVACENVSLELRSEGIHALIGPNGAGKTTLLGLLSGQLHADAGSILWKGREIGRLPAHARAVLGIARSFQLVSIFEEMSVLDNVALAVQAHAGSSFSFLADAGRDPGLVEPARALLRRVGLAELADRPARFLAHGQKRALDLAMALAGDPPVLLLDEPLAGMGPEEGRALTDLLAGLAEGRAILLVEHDMDAVFRLAHRITVLVYGRVIASGTPGEVRDRPEVQRAYLGTAEAGA